MSAIGAIVDAGKAALRYVGLMGPEPTEADRQRDWLNEQVDSMLSTYNAGNRPYEPIEDTGYEYTRGDQTRGLIIPKGCPPVAEDVIGPLIRQDTAILASRTPDIEVAAVSDGIPELEEAATIAEGHLRWQMRKNLDVQTMLIRAREDGPAAGWWVAQTWWDPFRSYEEADETWRGGVRSKLLHPRVFRGDPRATDWKEMTGRFVVCVVPTNELLRRYDDAPLDDEETKAEKARKRQIILEEAAKGEAERGGGRSSETEITPRRVNETEESVEAHRSVGWRSAASSPGRLLNALNQDVREEFRTGPNGEKSYASCLSVFEGIWDDHTSETVTDNVPMKREQALGEGRILEGADETTGLPMDYDAATGEAIDPTGSNWPTVPRTRQRPKYPHGRHVIRVGDTGIIEDEPWDYEHPLWTLGLNGYMPHTWRGEGDIERCRAAQDIHNIEASRIAGFKAKALTVRLLVAKGANANDPENARMDEEFGDRAGAAVNVNPQFVDKIRYVENPSVPLQLLQDEHERSKLMVKDQYGLHNVSQGQETDQQKTLGEVQLMAESDRFKTGLKAMLVDKFVVDLMEQVWELCVKNWDEGEWIPIIDERGALGYEQVTAMMLNSQFDISLETTTALPMDRERRRMEAVEFMKQIAALGDPRLMAMALRWVVKAFDPPDKDAILKEIEGRLEVVMPPAEAGTGEPAVEPQAETVAI
jgi:hypothetical protein